MPDKVTRREFVKGLAVTASATVLAACKPQVVKETVVVEKPVKEVVKETVVVEKPVEKVVKETVVVTEEKVVTPTPAPLEQIELLMQYRGEGAKEHMKDVWVDECLPRFQETHPNINVTWTPDVLPEKLIAAFVAGDAPDLMTQPGGTLPDFARRGQLENLQPYIDRDFSQDDMDDFYAEQVAFWRRDEEPVGQFGLPMSTQCLALYYNVDIFDEMGVEYPPRRWKSAWTYDEYAETMRKLLKKDDSGNVEHWGSQVEQWPDRVINHVRGFGGYYVDPEDNTHCLLGEPEAQEALWWLYDRTWKDETYVPLGNLADIPQWQTFQTGKVAISENGPWSLAYTVKTTEAKWNVAPHPRGPVKHQTLVAADGWGQWSGSKHPEAAWELMKFVTGRYMQKIQSRVLMYQPALKSVLIDWYGILRESYPALEEVDLEVFGDVLTEQGLGWCGALFKNPGATNQVWYPAIEQVLMTGAKTPDYFKEVAEEITRVNRED